MHWISSFCGNFSLIPDPTEIARLSPLTAAQQFGKTRKGLGFVVVQSSVDYG